MSSAASPDRSRKRRSAKESDSSPASSSSTARSHRAEGSRSSLRIVKGSAFSPTGDVELFAERTKPSPRRSRHKSAKSVPRLSELGSDFMQKIMEDRSGHLATSSSNRGSSESDSDQRPEPVSVTPADGRSYTTRSSTTPSSMRHVSSISAMGTGDILGLNGPLMAPSVGGGTSGSSNALGGSRASLTSLRGLTAPRRLTGPRRRSLLHNQNLVQELLSGGPSGKNGSNGGGIGSTAGVASKIATVRVRFKNDTFMGCLSRPKWWMDGDFEEIPNKITCKSTSEVVIRAQAKVDELMSVMEDGSDEEDLDADDEGDSDDSLDSDATSVTVKDELESERKRRMRLKKQRSRRARRLAYEPLVGMLSYALDIDPRYQKPSVHYRQRTQDLSVFNPFQHFGDRTDQLPFYNGREGLPSWMIGPGSLPFVPPSILRIYAIHQEFVTKVSERMEQQKQREQRRADREYAKAQKRERKQEELLAKQSKQASQQHESAMKAFMKTVSPVKKSNSAPPDLTSDISDRMGGSRSPSPSVPSSGKTGSSTSKRSSVSSKTSGSKRASLESSSASPAKPSGHSKSGSSSSSSKVDAVLQLGVPTESDLLLSDIEEEELGHETTHEHSTGDDSSSDEDESSESESDDGQDDGFFGWTDLAPPCFRVIVAWRIFPAVIESSKVEDKTDDTKSVVDDASLIVDDSGPQMSMVRLNQFKIAVFEDDLRKSEALTLNARSYDEVMRQALIADSEQCFEDVELYEITGTLGANAVRNEYTLCVDIDDGLMATMWPCPLPNLDVPRMAQFVAPVSYGRMPGYPLAYQGGAPSMYARGMPPPMSARPPAAFFAAGQAGIPGVATGVAGGQHLRLDDEQIINAAANSGAGLGGYSASSVASPISRPPKRNVPSTPSSKLTLNRRVSTLSEFVSDSSKRRASSMVVESTPGGIDYSQLSTGKYVEINGTLKGQIKWVGPSKKKGTLIFGVRVFKDGAGESDGTFEENRVFSCPKKSAMFVSRHRITKVLSEEELEEWLLDAESDTNNVNDLDDLPDEVPDFMREDYRTQLMLAACVSLAKTWSVTKKGTSLTFRTFKGLCLISSIETEDDLMVRELFDGCLKVNNEDGASDESNEKVSLDDLNNFTDKLKLKLGLSETEFQSKYGSKAITPGGGGAADGSGSSEKESSVPPMMSARMARAQSSRYIGMEGSSQGGRDSSQSVSKPPKSHVTPALESSKSSSSKKKKKSSSSSRGGKDRSSSIYRPTGGAPRGAVITRSTIGAIETHEGYKHIAEAKELQESETYNKAIKKYKMGIAMLEVALIQIDRGLQKRQWKEAIASYRHAMNRCQYAIRDTKRQEFIAAREKAKKKEIERKKNEERKKQERKMQLTVSGLQSSDTSPTREDDAADTTGVGSDDEGSEESGHSENGSDGDEGGIKGATTAEGKELSLPSYIDPTKKKKKHRKRRSSLSKGTGSRKSDDAKSEEEESEGSKKKKKPKYSKQDTELRERIASDKMKGGTTVTFQDVIGLNMVRLALFEHIILPQQRPDLFGHLPKSFGLLLFGPPGNGKTMIAKCVANEIDCTFFSISASSITSKFVGEAERIVRTLFDMARQEQPSIIFIDEIDSLLTARGGQSEAESSRRIKTEFLVQFDGVLSTKEAEARVVVIGATNLPHQLDEAVLRRFPKRILVPNPDREARYGLLRLLCKKQRHQLTEEEFQSLADSTDGYSGSDLTQLCQDAFMGPLREAMLKTSDMMHAKKSDIPQLGFRHFENSMKNVRASTAGKTLQFFEDWNSEYGSKLFLEPDVLPDSMKASPLISVEEEIRIREEAELKAEFMRQAPDSVESAVPDSAMD